MNIFSFLVVGLIAGWLVGKIMKGGGFGLIGNLIVGVVGAVIGGYVFDFLNISFGGFIGSVAAALVGAVLLLYLIRIIKKI